MIPNPWIILAMVLALIGAGVSGYFKGHADADAHWKIQMAEKQAEAEAKYHQLQEDTDAIRNHLEKENETISANLADALERLRHRPERLSAPALATCKGATGAELSGADAGFLEREAARADKLRAALDACQSWAETVTRK